LRQWLGLQYAIAYSPFPCDRDALPAEILRNVMVLVLFFGIDYVTLSNILVAISKPSSSSNSINERSL
jgi:hypothetical protein